jgi:hypothetical protein
LFPALIVTFVVVEPTVIASVPWRSVAVVEANAADASVVALASDVTVIEWLPVAAFDPAVAVTTESSDVVALLTKKLAAVERVSAVERSEPSRLLSWLNSESLLDKSILLVFAADRSAGARS